MRGPGASLLLAALAVAWLLCVVNAQPNATAVPASNVTANTTSAPTVAGGPLPAHHWGQGTTAAQPIDFTTGPATTAAFVHLSFGINVWNPQLTVAMFNKPGIRALFAQSIKNAVPDVVVVSEPLPATKGILVRSTVRFQADAAGARAQADALVKYLTDATLLKQMLPEANWHPRLAYTTLPYLASAVVYPVGPAADRVPSLHFTLQVQGIRKATFDAQKLAAWKKALKTALPGLTDQGIAAFTTETTELSGRTWYARTDTLVHTQITGPSLPALRLFSAKLRTKPQTIWSRYTFGAVEAVPRSWVIVAFAAPCNTLFCTTYSPGTCTCTACQANWQLRAGVCISVNTATLSAKDPQFVQKARTVGKRQALIVNNFVLEGDTKPSTLVLKRVEVWRPNAKVVTMTPRGPVTRGPPDTRMFRGTVAGSPGSSVVLTVRENGGVSGLALRGKSSWSLGKRGQGGSPTTAPLGSRKSRPGEQANLPKFTVDDVRHKPKSGASRAATPATGAFTAGTAGGLLQTVFNQPYQAILAVDTDNAYCDQFATEADAIDYAADLIGYADVVYSREIQTDMVIGYIRLWQKNVNSPYTAANSCDALDELKAAWDQQSTQRTLAIVLSGRTLGGGCAFQGHLCDAFATPTNNHAYGAIGDIGQGFQWDEDQSSNPTQTTWEVYGVLHEIGHVFNGPHTHDACGLKDTASAVDDCHISEASYSEPRLGRGDTLAEQTAKCPQPGVNFAGHLGVLPTCNPQQSPVWNGGRGTIMSYCHELSGSYDNIAFTFGEGQTNCPAYSPGRTTQLMQEHVRARADRHPTCFAARPQDWWGWKLTLGTGQSGTNADIQVRWSCGSNEATNGFIPLTRGDRKLCGTSSYTRLVPPEGQQKPQSCFARQTKEQFTVEYYPDNTPDAGFVLLRNRPSVEACKLAGGQPVLTVAFAGAEPWDLDTAKLTLELQYVASNVALNRLEVRSKTFKLCGTGAINRIAASNTFTYHTFRLCASEGTCQLFDEEIYKCNQNYYLVEGGKLRLFSPQAYASWGSPKPSSSALGDCAPGSRMHNCPAGAPMPTKPIIAPCTGFQTNPPCKSLSGDPTKCCACRKTKAQGQTTAYASVVAPTAYRSEPDCNRRLAALPANTQVAYTGAKLVGLTSAISGCTTPRDYAQVVVQVRDAPTVAWIDAQDLRFCTTRKCELKVELGAVCDDTLVRCCERQDEGGHPQATCKSPRPGAPTVCQAGQGCPDGQTLVNGNCCPNDRACGDAGCCAAGTECINGKCGTLVRGNPEITLRWYAPGTTDRTKPAHDDLDLHVQEPGADGEEISFRRKTSTSGGFLDVDANAGCGTPYDNPVEHVRWAAGTTPPSGSYKVWVELFAACTDAAKAKTPITYELTIEVNGRKVEHTGTLTYGSTEKSQDYVMVYP